MHDGAPEIDRDRALLDPPSVFEHPEDVVSADGLDHETKIEILRRWGYDALELEVAEEENMTGGEPSLLRRIAKALRAMGVEPDIIRRPPTKQGDI
jgi:hypothetical protein